MAVSELPGNPNAVWTVRRHVEGKGSVMEALVSVLIAGNLFMVKPGPRT